MRTIGLLDTELQKSADNSDTIFVSYRVRLYNSRLFADT